MKVQKPKLNNACKMRLVAGLTVIEAANKLGVARATIYDYEKGKSLPNVDKLARLAKIYNCEIKDLF